MKIAKPLEEAGLQIKGVVEKIRNKTKERKEQFLPMLLGTSGASILGNVLAEKGVIKADQNFAFNFASSFN